MDHIKVSDVPANIRPGRIGQSVFAGKGYVPTNDARMSFVTFAPKYGVMESHVHTDACEYMYVQDAKDAFVRYGSNYDQMTHKEPLAAGEIIRPNPGEWHRFDFSSPDGFVTFINFLPVGETNTITHDYEPEK